MCLFLQFYSNKRIFVFLEYLFGTLICISMKTNKCLFGVYKKHRIHIAKNLCEFYVKIRKS